MIGRRITVFVMLVVACLTGGLFTEARQPQNLAAEVAQHYPQALIDDALEFRGVAPPRNQCFAVLEASASGAPQLVIAGYTNMVSGAIRLLRAASTGFEVAALTDSEYITGWTCQTEAIDINNDGRKEAVVRFGTRNSTQDWLFEWDGQTFRNLAPVSGSFGLTGTALLNTSFIDIDGDHVMEAFTFGEPPREGQPLPDEVYRLVAGSYVLDRRIVAMRSFERASGAPETDTHMILRPVGAVGPFTLRISNGSGMSANGKRVENAVESGRVWWNGQEIASPNDFGNDIPLIERTVTLQPENELKVRLAGSPGGRIVIVIDAASWTP